ncbi:hypothetical protein ACVWWG_005224 [Bradyrhizobium sp. LB7.2]
MDGQGVDHDRDEIVDDVTEPMTSRDVGQMYEPEGIHSEVGTCCERTIEGIGQQRGCPQRRISSFAGVRRCTRLACFLSEV